MSEASDPYFRHRLEQARQHRPVTELLIETSLQKEVESNKNLPNPSIEGGISDFGWSQQAVDNFIDAVRKGYAKVERVAADRIKVEFLPLADLPKQLGQVSERSILAKNTKRGEPLYGDEANDKLTYLQTMDFAVEGYMDDEEHGKEYARIFVNSRTLVKYRNVYLDPESLHVTDYEYGHSFCVLGGIPFKAIDKIQIIRARRLDFKETINEEDWSGSAEGAGKEMEKQEKRLKEFLEELKIL